MASLKDLCLNEAESRVLAYVSRSVSRTVPFAARWRMKRANLVRAIPYCNATANSGRQRNFAQSSTLRMDETYRPVADPLQRSQQAACSSCPARQHHQEHRTLPIVLRDAHLDSDRAYTDDQDQTLCRSCTASHTQRRGKVTWYAPG
jgi:hypothetical protein